MTVIYLRTYRFLYAEGIVRSFDDVVDLSYCRDGTEPQQHNVVSVAPAAPIKSIGHPNVMHRPYTDSLLSL